MTPKNLEIMLRTIKQDIEHFTSKEVDLERERAILKVIEYLHKEYDIHLFRGYN